VSRSRELAKANKRVLAALDRYGYLVVTCACCGSAAERKAAREEVDAAMAAEKALKQEGKV